MQNSGFTKLISVRIDKEIYEKLVAEVDKRQGRRLGGGNYGRNYVTISSLINEYLRKQINES